MRLRNVLPCVLAVLSGCKQTPASIQPGPAQAVPTTAPPTTDVRLVDHPDVGIAQVVHSGLPPAVPPGTDAVPVLTVLARGHVLNDIPGLITPLDTTPRDAAAVAVPPGGREEVHSDGRPGATPSVGSTGTGLGGGGFAVSAPAQPSRATATDHEAVAEQRARPTIPVTNQAQPTRQPIDLLAIPTEPVNAELTAATVGDTDRRQNYLDFLGRHASEQSSLKIDLTRRVRLRVVDVHGTPIHDAAIKLTTTQGAIVDGRSHADGWWDFYPGFSAPDAHGTVMVIASQGGHTGTASFVVPETGDLANTVSVTIPDVTPVHPKVLDLAFVIDVTGSMGDELAYVRNEVVAITHRVTEQLPDVKVRLAATFYRDQSDEIVVQQIAFGTDPAAFSRVMNDVTATGGGDYPEDVSAGLDAAIHHLAWSETSAVRVMVLIGDAPPKEFPNVAFTWREGGREASRRGIRVLPVAASGADRTTEFVFRALGAFTSTPYVYLTDDSGIGGAHLEADTDRVGVEKFADVLVRLVVSDLRGEGMHEPAGLPNARETSPQH